MTWNPDLLLAGWANGQGQWWRDSNWWLVIIGGITAGFICWQSWETKRSAQSASQSVKAAKDSADAALLNAKAVISAERPWLLVKGQVSRSTSLGDISEISIFFDARNVGRSPAEVIFSGLDWRTILSGQKFDSHERFFSEGIPISTQWTHSKWIAPGEAFEADHFPMHSRDAGERWSHLMQGIQILYVMGFIRYRDAIGGDIHESRYCYSIPIRDGEPVMTGPLGYNKLT